MSDGTIPREVAEGFTLLNDFYGFSHEGDPDQFIMKESFRQDVYRLIVIQFHLTIEELLRGFIYEALRHTAKGKVFTNKQNVEYVQRLNSAAAIDLAARLGILTALGHAELIKLNKIRNQCSHNWTLHAYTMAKASKRAPKKRKYKIEFNGKNLLSLEVMEGEFIPLYSHVYLELYAIYYGIRWKRKYLQKGVTGPPEKKL